MPGVLPLPSDDYLAAHIPGAVFFDVNAIADPNDPRPHMYPAPSSSRATSRRSAFPAAIPWWPTIPAAGSPRPGHGGCSCRSAIADVKVLDGGLQKWLREGRPTHSGKVTPKPGKFQAKLDPSFVRSKQQLLGNIETHAEQLVDARPRPRFEGTVAEPWPGRRSGHIPGSRNVPYAELFDASTGAMKPLEDLRKAFADGRRRLTKPIVTTCGSGVSALVLTLALYRLGVRGTALYDGSWAEWGLPDGPPVATGPA